MFRGIETSDVGNDGERIPLRRLQWNRIAKLNYDKRKVTITGLDGVSLALYVQFEDKARYLLEFCKAFHQATLFINNRFAFRQNREFCNFLDVTAFAILGIKFRDVKMRYSLNIGL